MIDIIIRMGIATVAATVAYFVDKEVKEKTGKHIHQHVTDFIGCLYQSLQIKILKWEAAHNNNKVVKIFAKVYAVTDRISATVSYRFRAKVETDSGQEAVIETTELSYEQFFELKAKGLSGNFTDVSSKVKLSIAH